jgi:hypothetical protein
VARWGWAAAAVGLSACSAPALVIQLPPPTVDGAVSRVIAYESRSAAGLAVTRVIASKSPDEPFEQLLDPPGDGRIVALYFDLALGRLRIPSGELAPIKDTVMGASTLPRAAAAFALDLSRGRPGDWARTATGTLDAPLEGFHFAEGPQICTMFRTSSIAIPAAKRPLAFMTAIPAIHGALIGSEDGRVFKVDGDAQVTELPSGRSSTTGEWTEGAITAAVVLDDGRIWFGDREGSLFRGRFDALDAAERVVRTSTEQVDTLDVTRSSSEEFEAFVITRYGKLLHVDDHFQVTELHNFMERAAVETNERGGVVRVGPGRALAVHGTPYLAEIERLDQLPVLAMIAPEGLTTVAVMPGYGPLVASKMGRVSRRVGLADWVDMPETDSHFNIQGFAPYRDGWVYGGEVGLVGEWSARNSFCAPHPAGYGAATICGIVPLNNETLFLGATVPDTKAGLLPSLLTPLPE